MTSECISSYSSRKVKLVVPLYGRFTSVLGSGHFFVPSKTATVFVA